MITLTDGSQIEYHASFKFPQHIYDKFNKEDKARLHAEREEYKKNKRQRISIDEVMTRVQALEKTVPTTVSTDAEATQISQLTTGTTKFGGKNNKVQKKRNNIPEE